MKILLIFEDIRSNITVPSSWGRYKAKTNFCTLEVHIRYIFLLVFWVSVGGKIVPDVGSESDVVKINVVIFGYER